MVKNLTDDDLRNRLQPEEADIGKRSRTAAGFRKNPRVSNLPNVFARPSDCFIHIAGRPISRLYVHPWLLVLESSDHRRKGDDDRKSAAYCLFQCQVAPVKLGKIGGNA